MKKLEIFNHHGCFECIKCGLSKWNVSLSNDNIRYCASKPIGKPSNPVLMQVIEVTCPRCGWVTNYHPLDKG